MAVVYVLVGAVLLARLAGVLGVAALAGWPGAVRAGLAVMLLFTGVAHFVEPIKSDLVRMMPPAIPAKEFFVAFTGVCEIAGAIGLLVPQTRHLAAWLLIVFLLCVLPANIHAARAGVTLNGKPVTPLVPRVVLQAVFIGLVWWSGLHASGIAPRR